MGIQHGQGEQPEGDLSLFEEAMQEIDDDSPTTEYEAIYKVLKELSEKYGIEFSVSDGRALGSPMALNHRLDEFSYRVGGIPNDVAMAIQSNKFTLEMGERILESVCDEESLFVKSADDLERMRNSAYQLIEALLFLGQSKYGDEHELVQQQKDMMVADIRSYDAMISTFSRYMDFIDNYIERRPLEDAEIINLSEAMLLWTDKDKTKLESRFPGYQKVLTEIDTSVKRALGDRGPVEITKGELRQIVRAYKNAVKLELLGEDFKPVVDYTALEECIRYIGNS